MSKIKLTMHDDSSSCLMEGISSEAFWVDRKKCQDTLNRLYARKQSYDPDQYASRRAPYLEAAKLGGWDVVDPEPRVEPSVPAVAEPEAAKPVVPETTIGLLNRDVLKAIDQEQLADMLASFRVEPSVVPEAAKVEAPPVQIDEVFSGVSARVEPLVVPEKVSQEAQTWLERMMAAEG